VNGDEVKIAAQNEDFLLDLAPSEKAPTLTSDTQSLKEILKSQKINNNM
jgi:hypothetical protein